MVEIQANYLIHPAIPSHITPFTVGGIATTLWSPHRQIGDVRCGEGAGAQARDLQATVGWELNIG